jgi:hypothetical protein
MQAFQVSSDVKLIVETKTNEVMLEVCTLEWAISYQAALDTFRFFYSTCCEDLNFPHACKQLSSSPGWRKWSWRDKDHI